MKKQSLRERMLLYLKRQDGWVNGGELERLSLSSGYKASNISRRARECAEEGILERKLEKGSVLYRYAKNTPTISKRDDRRPILPEVLHNRIEQERSQDRVASQLDLCWSPSK